MCFLDITGYTRLTQEHGDAAAAQLAEQLGGIVQRTSVRHGGRPVKWLGDGVMLHFPNPGLGVVAALEMVDGVAEAGLPPAHVGLHAGPGDLPGGRLLRPDGQPRLADRRLRAAGEVIVSQAVVDACGRRAGRLPRRRPGGAQGRGRGDAPVRGVATGLTRRATRRRWRDRASKAYPRRGWDRRRPCAHDHGRGRRVEEDRHVRASQRDRRSRDERGDGQRRHGRGREPGRRRRRSGMRSGAREPRRGKAELAASMGEFADTTSTGRSTTSSPATIT